MAEKYDPDCHAANVTFGMIEAAKREAQRFLARAFASAFEEGRKQGLKDARDKLYRACIRQELAEMKVAELDEEVPE